MHVPLIRLNLLRTDCEGRIRAAGNQAELKANRNPTPRRRCRHTLRVLALTSPRRALMAYRDRNEDLARADCV